MIVTSFTPRFPRIHEESLNEELFLRALRKKKKKEIGVQLTTKSLA
jgi:hypothetical protein